MKRLLTRFCIGGAVVGLSHLAFAATTLPANIQADRATIQQDNTNLDTALTQLRTDERARNSSAIDADRSAIRIAQLQRQLDLAKLAQDAQSIVMSDETTLLAAVTQLHADQVSGSSNVSADEAAVQQAQTQLTSDREAIFGDLGSPGAGGPSRPHE